MAKSLDKYEQNKNVKKQQLLAALEQSLGVVTTACQAVGCSRTTFYSYMDEDPEFKAQVDEMEHVALDYVESSLYEQIKDGNTSATIFYLKCKGKKRGWIDSPGQEPPSDEEVIISFD